MLGNLVPSFIKQSISPERKGTVTTQTQEQADDLEEGEVEEEELIEEPPHRPKSPIPALFENGDTQQDSVVTKTPSPAKEAERPREPIARKGKSVDPLERPNFVG